MVNITANNVDIHETVEIGNNVRINCDTIKLGKFCKIGDNVTIDCKTFESDEWLFMWDGVEVGRGGCYGPNSSVKIGKGVGIFERTIINPSESVEIGDNCGIGADVMIWTHGAWLDVLDGFPSDFGPVRLGKNVWLHCHQKFHSIINKDLPSGCLAAGTPCKVIREKLYPKKVTPSEQSTIIKNIVGKWYELHDTKGIKGIQTKYEDGKIKLIQGENLTIYDIEKKVIEGYNNNVSEDLRDFLRRNGIKIYTDRFFTSITPTWINK